MLTVNTRERNTTHSISRFPYDFKEIKLMKIKCIFKQISKSITDLHGLGHKFSLIKWKKPYVNNNHPWL